MKTDAAHCAGNVERVVEQYGDMLFQLCLVMLTNPGDAEDAVQDTLLRYLQKAPNFENAEHEKAWLITVAANRCRDMKRFFVRHPQTNLEEIHAYACRPEDNGLLDTLLELPDKIRIVLVLYYVHGYQTAEIAKIIGKSASAVKMRLFKGRKLLKKQLEKEEWLYE